MLVHELKSIIGQNIILFDYTNLEIMEPKQLIGQPFVTTTKNLSRLHVIIVYSSSNTTEMTQKIYIHVHSFYILKPRVECTQTLTNAN